jgi:hypothetical protein
MIFFKHIFCWLLLLPIDNFIYGQSDSSHMFKYYNLNSCKITFEFFDGMNQGEKIIVFNDSGLYEKEIVVAHFVNDSILKDSLLAQFSKKGLNALVIKTPQSTYTIDLDTRTGTKQDRRPLPFGNEFFSPDKKVVGRDTILGRPCEVVVYNNAMKVWYWKNIALKKQMVVDGVVIQECVTSIDELYSIKKDEFAIPKGVDLRVYLVN